MAYASRTSVSVDRTRSEIEKNLHRFGAEGFAYGWDAGQELIGFVYKAKNVRMSIPMPARSKFRNDDQFEQERRRRWRSLGMVVKAKLVSVSDGIMTFEDEFLSYFVMPNGKTLGQALIPRLEAAATRGELPALLPEAGHRE